MNTSSIAVIILAAICLYNSLIFIVIYFQTKNAVFAWFALTCFFIAGYDFASAGLYNADNFASGLYWQKLQFADLNLVAISFLWFFWTFLQIERRNIPYILSIIFISLFVSGLIIDESLTLSINTDIPKILGVGDFFKYKVYEGTPELIYIIEYGILSGGLFLLLIFSLTSKAVKIESSVHKNIFIISFTIFAVCSFNDILVGLNIYTSIYTVEYGYLSIVFFMTYLLLDTHLQMFRDVSSLNVSLESRVRNRTETLERKIKEINVLSGLLPICASCKKIRDDEGYWNQIESYISKHSDTKFSHGICDECAEKLYGDESWFNKRKNDL